MNFQQSPHADVVVNKPWGYEYLAYENEWVALWVLHIQPGAETSLHCHPKKTTGLVLIDGEAELVFLADSKRISAPYKAMIRRGLFHATKAVGDTGIIMLEIETPNDKGDLVRLNDAYGRSAQGYEKSNSERPRTAAEIRLVEPNPEDLSSYSLGPAKLFVEQITSLDQILGKRDDDIIMFLRGGLTKMVDGVQHFATVPGDVGVGTIVKRVASELQAVAERTVVLTISASQGV